MARARKTGAEAAPVLAKSSRSRGQDSDAMTEDSSADKTESSVPLRCLTPGSLDAASSYVQLCRRYDMPADPAVSVWLRLGGDHLTISPVAPFEGCLLPLHEFLGHAPELRKLSLHVPRVYRDCGACNANARVLREVLRTNKNLEVLDLQATGLDEHGMADLVEGLQQNKTLRQLNLRGNFLGPEGGRLLADVLLQHRATGLRHIDVSYNHIGFEGARRLMHITGRTVVDSRVQSVLTEDGPPVVEVMGNFVTEELWNGVTHGIAVILSVLGSVLLLRKVSSSPVHHIWGCVLFCFSLLFMFLSSTLYHSLFMYPKTWRVFQVLDHCGIFVLIAGTYSPFTLFSATEPALGLFKVEWTLCGLGIIAHICSQYWEWGTSRLYLTSELLLYLFMGWAGVLMWDSLFAHLPAPALRMVVGGGILYTAGVPFFIMGDYRPICHAIWHVFVVGAAICHWFSVKDALMDAMKHHSEGPFIPEIAWYNNQYEKLVDEVKHLVTEAKNMSLGSPLHSLQERVDSQALLLTGLAALANVSGLERLVPGWGRNGTDLLMQLSPAPVSTPLAGA